MRPASIVFVHPWTGRAEAACKAVASLYPDATLRVLAHRELRELGWRKQLRAFRELKGQALVFFFKSLEDMYEPQILPWVGLVHRCKETVLADEASQTRVYRRKDWLRLFPSFLLSGLLDGVVLIVSYVILRLLILRTKPVPLSYVPKEKTPFDLAYLYPYPQDRAGVGGAMTHVYGLLAGLAAQGARCTIFSGRPLDAIGFPLHEIPAKRRFYLLRELLLLSYNVTFSRGVARELRKTEAKTLYQRHGRFVVAGALVSRSLQIPLVLEYNGSEDWIAGHWDPARFRFWLRLCEDCALASASLIVVVSDALREELISRGIPSERILVTPNAVDPAIFRPGRGGEDVRRQLGFVPADVVVCFLGTFSYWHGIEVLQDAIHRLLNSAPQSSPAARLRFLLVGQGPLQAEMRRGCAKFEEAGVVVFTGAVAHERVPAYLDAADILVSPHVPMPDGRPFFGSPTKLFEYMAMGKAIVASNLDQLGRVLRHGETAWLVPPGDANQLAAAIQLLACEPETRARLGRKARKAATDRYTWAQNAARLLARLESSSRALGQHVVRTSDYARSEPLPGVVRPNRE
jgi:glycosyltransferase involved in cell wall biosynthesis